MLNTSKIWGDRTTSFNKIFSAEEELSMAKGLTASDKQEDMEVTEGDEVVPVL